MTPDESNFVFQGELKRPYPRNGPKVSHWSFKQKLQISFKIHLYLEP